MIIDWISIQYSAAAAPSLHVYVLEALSFSLRLLGMIVLEDQK